ncbi:MAG: hypothetical protein JRI67_11835, partial [Deltaproteobacteria bacterium]|nr:hypothetical protein [Deltaproteobacteria bacterium]
MTDQHNPNIPAAGNVIADDVVDIKENLEFHKDCFQAICSGWSDNSTASLLVYAFASGTIMMFAQASAPSGWTKELGVGGWQDGAMIVINTDADGTALGSGG